MNLKYDEKTLEEIESCGCDNPWHDSDDEDIVYKKGRCTLVETWHYYKLCIDKISCCDFWFYEHENVGSCTIFPSKELAYESAIAVIEHIHKISALNPNSYERY